MFELRHFHTPEAPVMTGVCEYLVYTSARPQSRGFKPLFLFDDYLGPIYVDRKPTLDKAPPELLCGKENTSLRVTQQGQKVILREAAQVGSGWPCPASQEQLPAAQLGGSGR